MLIGSRQRLLLKSSQRIILKLWGKNISQVKKAKHLVFL